MGGRVRGWMCVCGNPGQRGRLQGRRSITSLILGVWHRHFVLRVALYSSAQCVTYHIHNTHSPRSYSSAQCAPLHTHYTHSPRSYSRSAAPTPASRRPWKAASAPTGPPTSVECSSSRVRPPTRRYTWIVPPAGCRACEYVSLGARAAVRVQGQLGRRAGGRSAGRACDHPAGSCAHARQAPQHAGRCFLTLRLVRVEAQRACCAHAQQAPQLRVQGEAGGAERQRSLAAAQLQHVRRLRGKKKEAMRT